MYKKNINTSIRRLSCLTLFLLMFFSQDAFSGRAVRQWQTTKTSSLAGAGIAAPTMVEGLYLNPAMLSYFTNSSFYFQNHDGKIDPMNVSNRSSTFGEIDHPNGFSAAITDGSNDGKGGFSYTDQTESGTERKKYTFGMGMSIDGDSSFGINYSYLVDEFKDGLVGKKDKIHVGSLGYMKILSSKLSYALTWYDPAWADRINSKAVFGIHYSPIEKLSFMLDFGHDIKRSLNKTFYYATGLEIEVVTDVYLRSGLFEDKLFNLRGYGFGVGWVGPKLGLEIAMKQSKRKDEFNTFLLKDEVLKETEASLLYSF